MLQTSSNQRNSHRLTRTPVTNVVNPSPKTAIISEKALRLTTFVTTGQKSTRKTPWIDDVCNNTHESTPKTQHARPRDAHRERQGLAKQQASAPSNISDLAPLVWRAPEGPEGTGELQNAGPGRGAGGWRQGQGVPRDRPLRAVRLACGDLAGGPPPTGTPSDLAHRSGRHNKTARPQWGRAAVAVALGFEPRVAVTPHSISSAAPSAARTRYLTRILYYTLPLRAQIDRAGWEQGHIAAWEQGPTRSHDSIRNRRHLTI